MSHNIAAFFDIDGTIYREGLITEVFKKMVNHELIDASEWYDRVRPAFMAWDRRQGDYDIYLDRMVEAFKKVTVGISREHIDLIARKVIEQKGDRVYQFTRNEIEKHKALGHKIIAISGSPDALVKYMAEKYEFDDWRGTVYHTDEKGIYTGEITPMWDAVSKQKAILELAGEYGLDLTECYSYGDTNGDFTMFENTGHPTAINPTRELLDRIRENESVMNKIKVIVERKDVIYHLDVRTIDYE
ncbi:MAG: HAD-IB family hydrolase [Erysipelotrichaceae bacterium]|nr:HAD-IB family hydrolase [Erysipelotrichaceae bacterium]